MSKHSRKLSVPAPSRSFSRSFTARVGGPLGLALASLVMAASATAATITVGNPGDPATGNAANCDVPETCTLRDAIARAAKVTGAAAGDTIVFSLPAKATIMLSGNELLVDRSLEIDGSAVAGLTISGNDRSRVLSVGPGVMVQLKRLVITKGNCTDDATGGGGILNNGSISLISSTLTGNAASYQGGGALSYGSMTLIESDVVSNGAYNGGGIYATGSVTLINSTISTNVAGADGGGIKNGGGLFLVNSYIVDNEARFHGGGVSSLTVLEATGSTISNNKSDEGGGIYNFGNLLLVESTISDNAADTFGGGISNWGGSLTLADSVVTGNTANAGGGGILNVSEGYVALIRGMVSGNSTNGGGGGIQSFGTVAISDTEVSGNMAKYTGGGIHSGGMVTMSGSMVSSNVAESGGGIYKISGTASLVKSTVYGNKAIHGVGGGIYNDGGYNGRGGILAVIGSTVSDNTAFSGSGGGIYNNGGSKNLGGTLMMTGSTVSGNAAIGGFGGGIYNHGNENGLGGTVALTNSTLFGNTADLGAGIENAGVITLIQSTLADNSVAGISDDLHHTGSSAALANMIIQRCSLQDAGAKPLTDNGGNLDGGEGCSFTSPSSKSNATLDLGDLADNGGPTPTMMPGVGSDAIGFGRPAACRSAPVDSRDQRGYVRPAVGCTSGAIDPGALENESIFLDGFGFGGQ